MKFFIAFLFACLSFNVNASSASAASNYGHSSAITWNPDERVLSFRENWHDTNGDLLVCLKSWSKCIDYKPEDWIYVKTLVPIGWKIKQYSYVWAGKDGTRILVIILQKN